MAEGVEDILFILNGLHGSLILELDNFIKAVLIGLIINGRVF